MRVIGIVIDKYFESFCPNSIIKTDILQAALYGCETIKASIEAIGELRTAIANAIGTGSSHRAIEMIVEANDDGKGVDPNVQTLVRKVALMRRTIDDFPEEERTYVENIKDTVFIVLSK